MSAADFSALVDAELLRMAEGTLAPREPEGAVVEARVLPSCPEAFEQHFLRLAEHRAQVDRINERARRELEEVRAMRERQDARDNALAEQFVAAILSTGPAPSTAPPPPPPDAPTYLLARHPGVQFRKCEEDDPDTGARAGELLLISPRGEVVGIIRKAEEQEGGAE